MLQLHVWLGIGSAGGAISMVTLAAHLPDPAYVFRFLQFSLWCFLVGVVAAGAAIFFLALRANSMSAHVAGVHNREQFKDAARAIPEMISSPRRIADDANRGRNALLERSDKEHRDSEKAWVAERRCFYAWAISLVVSALGFVAGFAWPLVQVSFLGRSLVP